MKKLYLILFFTSCFLSFTSFVKAWESSLKTGCINENLDPCSSSEILSSKSTENPELDLGKVIDKEKEVVKKEIKKKKTKKIVKKKKKNIFKKFSSNKSKKNTDFEKSNSFEDFKTMLINYNDKSDYPNIDN